jgi:glycosyltransferase involved in cell wall biosynthesis
VLSGAGPLEADLRALVAAAGLGSRVVFPGFLQYGDLPACYGLAGAFVLPSGSDQWGLVVNEAMAAGIPVLVSSRCGCTPELVRPGENGFTFEPGDPVVLAGLLQRVAGMQPEERAAMGSLSRKVVAAFSPEAFACGLKAAIGCALGRRIRRGRHFTRAVLAALAARPVR